MASPRLQLVSTCSGQQLEIDGEPFLILPGELQNSSFSSAEHMLQEWDNLKLMGVNTILASVAWEDIEPVEGDFRFTQLDINLAAARQHGFRLILVWFGSYKNGMSTYVPPWVKLDANRFPRAQVLTQRGCAEDQLKTIEVLSPFAENNWTADAVAFKTLMTHLREIDAANHTVVMMQVENEPGILGGDGRDRSSSACEAWNEPPSPRLLRMLSHRREYLHPIFKDRSPLIACAEDAESVEGMSWSQVFGTNATEAFMADALSKYVEQVAKAGRSAYEDPPLFVNAWLSCDDASALDLAGIPLKHNLMSAAGGGNRPGDFPSGGCCPQVIDIWEINAPSLDLLCPNVYLHDFPWVCEQYTFANRSLFVPEMRRDSHGARRLMYAYGNAAVIGASPFGIDTLNGRDPGSVPFARVFKLLQKVAPWIHSSRRSSPKKLVGLLLRRARSSGASTLVERFRKCRLPTDS